MNVNQEQKKQRHPDRRKLWGRAKGKRLSPHQTSLMENLLPQLRALPSPLENFEPNQRVTLEIGFGGGEHLLHLARRFPDEGFIGAEPFLNGVAKTLNGISNDGLKNIRIHHGDVSMVLQALPDACLERIYILYPDPWPKPRHYKRRLIQEEFIAELFRVLKPNAELRFASDIVSYVDWALARILRHGGFLWRANSAADWLTPYKNWPSTRYEAKAFREGRTPHYFTFIKGKLPSEIKRDK